LTALFWFVLMVGGVLVVGLVVGMLVGRRLDRRFAQSEESRDEPDGHG
jgi:uncharacterized membrane-anchored protein YhcB (DUF1043 family)